MNQQSEDRVLNPCEPYQQIPTYVAGMVLPDYFTILYLRLSKDDPKKNKKEDESNSIINQKRLTGKHAFDYHLPNPVYFIDDGISGTTFDRESVQAALGFVEEGRVPSFVVKDLSRFGRNNGLVTYYTEHVFPQKDVRFIAIGDDVDDTTGEGDIKTQFQNMYNEHHPRETSKKVKDVFQYKGTEGKEPLAFNAPYGYMKDPNNSKRWIVDEPAAKVVKQVFQWCMEGFGPTRIAKKLREAKVEMPIIHAIRAGHRKGGKGETALNPYDWNDSTVVKILERREYLGHLVNFKTYSKSFKHKKRLKNDPSKHVVIENAHEAIIKEDAFERVQQLRSHKRRPCNSGRENVLAGLAYCFDCNSKLNMSSGASQKADQDYFCCSGFRSKKKRCESSHFIRRVVLEAMVLEGIQKVTAFAREHESLLIRMLEARNATQLATDMATDKKRLSQSEKRIGELDAVVKKLLEKNALGTMSDDMFARLSQDYELERKTLEDDVETLRMKIAKEQEVSTNIHKFLAKIRKYTSISELTPVMLNELIERVEVHARSERYSKGSQHITIRFNYVGDILGLGLPNPQVVKKQPEPLLEMQYAIPVPKQLEKIPVMSTVNG